MCSSTSSSSSASKSKNTDVILFAHLCITARRNEEKRRLIHVWYFSYQKWKMCGPKSPFHTLKNGDATHLSNERATNATVFERNRRGGVEGGGGGGQILSDFRFERGNIPNARDLCKFVQIQTLNAAKKRQKKCVYQTYKKEVKRESWEREFSLKNHY